MLTSGCSISQLQQRKSRRGVKQVNTKPWIHAVIFRQNGNFNRKPWPAKTQLLSSANTLITTLILLVLQNTTTVCFQRMLGNRISHFKNCHPRNRSFNQDIKNDSSTSLHRSDKQDPHFKTQNTTKNMHNFQAAAPPRFTDYPCKTSWCNSSKSQTHNKAKARMICLPNPTS
jgi:hypothetical protein